MLSNPKLRFLILVGDDSPGHLPGQTLLALAENGVDTERRVIDSNGKRPILRNVSFDEIDAFREQITVIDMIGCIDVMEIASSIQRLTSESEALNIEQADTVPNGCGCSTCNNLIVEAASPATIKLDEAGYFVIFPQQDNIIVEHYAYDNTLLHTIRGTNARDIFWTIINNEWITELSHAAYLGKELARAEMAVEHGWTYVQDGA